MRAFVRTCVCVCVCVYVCMCARAVPACVGRALDATGVLLELVCGPVREYLKKRPDTVRCIVHLLIAEDTDNFDVRLDSLHRAFLEHNVSTWLQLHHTPCVFLVPVYPSVPPPTSYLTPGLG